MRPAGFGRVSVARCNTLMISHTGVATTKDESVGASQPDRPRRVGLLSLLIVSAWCGLVAGLLEVGTFVVRKQFFDTDQFYRMSRHFIWLIPLTNLGIGLALALVGGVVVWIGPRRGRWLFARALGTFIVLPALLVALPRIYTLALVAMAIGLAARVVPIVERASNGVRRVVLLSLPAAVAILALLAASLWAGDLMKERRETQTSLPPPGSPNVLLIVLDTVAAGHLSLYGYERPTSTTLAELAEPRRAVSIGPRGFVVDVAITRKHVHRSLVARALRGLVHAA